MPAVDFGVVLESIVVTEAEVVAVEPAVAEAVDEAVEDTDAGAV